MAIPTITPLPTPPSRKRPSTFANEADAWNAAFPQWTTEANALAGAVEDTANGIGDSVQAAEDGADKSQEWASKPNALVDAIDYSSKEWAQGETAESARRWATETGSTVDGTEYAAKEYASGSFVPTGSAKNWATSEIEVADGLKGGRGYAKDAKYSADAAAATANFQGEWSTLTGAYAKGISVRNNGTTWILLVDVADITLSEPTAANADWDYVNYPAYELEPDGVVLKKEAGGLAWGDALISEYQEFTTSGTFTKDPNATWIYVEAVGGGGAGGSDSAADEAGGGGGGQGVHYLFRASDIGLTETIIIGTGGVGVTGNSEGQDGGSTSFGAILTALPGLGGGNSSYNIALAPSSGGGGTLPTLNGGSAYGFGSYQSGSGCLLTTGAVPGFPASKGGDSVIGGAGGGCVNSANSLYPGGTSTFAGDGGSAGFNSSAGNGEYPGGGGGGANNGFKAGDGGDGRVRIWQW